MSSIRWKPRITYRSPTDATSTFHLEGSLLNSQASSSTNSPSSSQWTVNKSSQSEKHSKRWMMGPSLPLYHPLGPLALSLPDLDPTAFGLPPPPAITYDPTRRSSNRARRPAAKVRDANDPALSPSPSIIISIPPPPPDPQSKEKPSPRRRRAAAGGGGASKRKRREPNDGDAPYPAKRTRNNKNSAATATVAPHIPKSEELELSPPPYSIQNSPSAPSPDQDDPEQKRPERRCATRSRGSRARRGSISTSSTSEATATSVSVSVSVSIVAVPVPSCKEVGDAIETDTSLSSGPPSLDAEFPSRLDAGSESKDRDKDKDKDKDKETTSESDHGGDKAAPR